MKACLISLFAGLALSVHGGDKLIVTAPPGELNRPSFYKKHVSARTELRDYDPGLAAMCREVFGDTELAYTKPTTRLHGHLKGYDPSKAPTFEWPARLDEVRNAIKEKAKARSKAKSRRKPYVN